MPASSRGNWPKVAIGGLVLINLVLFALLVLREPSQPLTGEPAAPANSSSASPPESAPAPSPSATASSAGPSGTPSLSPSETSSFSATEQPDETVGLTRVLAVNSDRLGWRAVFGPCPTDPEVEVSRDGGRTWRSTSAGLDSVSRLRSYRESAVFAVGGTKGCDARYVATGGPGESWQPDGSMLDQTWYRLPTDTHRVHAPAGRVSTPCSKDLSDFTGLGNDNGAAVCGNGTVRLTQDGGRRWRDLDGAADPLAVNADDSVYVLALRRDDCAGVAVAVFDPDAERVDRDTIRCAPVGEVASDKVAVAIRERVVWVWAGDEVAVSANRGRDWSSA